MKRILILGLLTLGLSVSATSAELSSEKVPKDYIELTDDVVLVDSIDLGVMDLTIVSNDVFNGVGIDVSETVSFNSFGVYHSYGGVASFSLLHNFEDNFIGNFGLLGFGSGGKSRISLSLV